METDVGGGRREEEKRRREERRERDSKAIMEGGLHLAKAMAS